MAGNNEIKIILTLDGKQYAVNLDRAVVQTKEAGAQMNRSGTQAAAFSSQMRGAGFEAAGTAGKANMLTGALRGMGLAFGAASIGLVAKDIVTVGVAFQTVDRQLEAATGGLKSGAEAFKFVSAESERLGLQLLDNAAGFGVLAGATRGTNIEGERTRLIYSATAEAAAKLNLSQADVNGVLRAFSQMASKGTVQAEELRGQLGDRLPGALQIAARALNVTQAELNQMLLNGEVLSEDFLPKFAEEMRRTFGTDTNTRVETTQASFNRLRNEISLLSRDLSDGLNPVLSESSSILAGMVRSTRELGEGFSGSLRTIIGFLKDPRGTIGRALTAQFESPEVTKPPPFLDMGLGGASNPNVDEALDALQKQVLMVSARNELEKQSALIAAGYYGEVSAGAREQILQTAREIDQQTQLNESRRKAQQMAEQELRHELQMEEQQRDKVKSVQEEALVLAEELRTHEKMTGAERQLFLLRNASKLDLHESLEIALQHLDVEERQARAEQERADAIQRGADNLRKQEERIERERASGRISRFDAARQTDDARQSRIGDIEQQLGMGGLNLRQRADLQDELDLIRQAREPVAELSRMIADLDSNVLASFRDSADAAFAGWIRGTKSAGEAWKEFTSSVLDDLSKLLAKMIETALITSLLNQFGMTLSNGNIVSLPGGASSGAGGGGWTPGGGKSLRTSAPSRSYAPTGNDGGGVVVQIVNLPGQTAVEQPGKVGSDGRWMKQFVIQTMNEDLNGSGFYHRNLQAQLGLRRAPRGAAG